MNRALERFLRSHHTAILHEDDSLLALDKPSGLLVLPDRYDRSLANLFEGLRAEMGEIFAVHRIDRETSGVVIFAKSAEAHRQLSLLFESHAVEKTYRAIVRGRPARLEGDIRLPIPVRQGGTTVHRSSETLYRVVEQFRHHCLLEVKPLTGRTHQIRIHLRSIGLPIVGDRLHGDGKPFMLSEIKPTYTPGPEGERPLLDRTALHAGELTFPHPATQQTMVLRSELPKDMRSVLQVLRKYSNL